MSVEETNAADELKQMKVGGLSALKKYASNPEPEPECVDVPPEFGGPPPAGGPTPTPAPASIQIEEQVQAEAVDDWDKVNEMRADIDASQAAAAAASDQELGYDDAARLFRTEYNWKRLLPEMQAKMAKNAPSKGCCSKPYDPEVPINLGNKELTEAANFVLCMLLVKLDHSDILHRRLLITLYKKMTGENKNVPTTGGHWERLGFQGNDPMTDLRAAGMFSMIQLMYLFDKQPAIARTIYTTGTSPAYDYPVALCSINFTGMVITAFKKRKLDSIIKKERDTLSALNKVYTGCYCYFYKLWTSKDRRTISEFDEVRKQVERQAVSKPESLLSAFSEANLKGL